MITLQTAPEIKSVLGGAGTVAYDRFILSTITYDTVAQTINAVVRITSTAQPDMQAINGQFKVDRATGKVEIMVQQLDFYRRITLTGPQSTSLENHIRGTQDTLEGVLVTLGLIAGTQATGT